MIELAGKPAEVSFTIDVKRAATGITETYQMVGHVVPEPAPTLGEENGSQSLDISA